MSHKSYRILAITVTLLLAGIGLPAPAQQCIPDLSGFRLGTKPPSNADGLVHITYQFVDELGGPSSPSQPVRAAFQAAIDDWNSRSGTTGVVFEPAPAGSSGDLQFMPEPNSQDPCASYSPTTDRIYYNPSGFAEAAQERPIFAAAVMRHELGHFLGLNEGAVNPSPPSIMNNPVVNPGDRCKDLFVPTLFVQDNDATKVGECVAQARQQHTVAPSYAYNEYNFTYGCYSYYEVTDYYLCFGNSCSYWFSTYSFLGSNCMLTQ